MDKRTWTALERQEMKFQITYIMNFFPRFTVGVEKQSSFPQTEL